MPRKLPKPRKTNDPAQLERFKAMAREVEVNESPDAFDRAFRKVVGPPKKMPVVKPD